MRTIVFAVSLVMTFVLVISGHQLGQGTPSAGTIMVRFLLGGLGWLGCMMALLALLGHRPSRDRDVPGMQWVAEGLRHQAPVLLVIACAGFILHMLIGSLISGSIATLMGRYPVQWDRYPIGFVIHFIVWGVFCWVLGWRVPRKMLSKKAAEDGSGS